MSVLTQTSIDVPGYENILQSSAAFIFEQYSSNSNDALDLSSLYILLPGSQAVEQFTHQLYKAIPETVSAIIPPWSGTLKNWTSHFIANPEPESEVDKRILTNHDRQLLFIEALQNHHTLFKEENQWQVAQALLSLFDDLNLNQKDFFNSTEEWQQQLQQAYGLENEHEHLLYESKLVFTLWHAWQQQLKESELIDETTDYIIRLKSATSSIEPSRYFVCVGFNHYSRIEQEFVQNLVAKNQCAIIDYTSEEKSIETNQTTEESPSSLFHQFITQAFATTSTPFKQRALDFSQQHANKKLPFSTYLATSEEEQVRAIDLYVRQNLLEGNSHIAIISEDRKLSRRLRALLERANVPLNDKAGWSLATTQASTIVERWLECIEEDFSAYPLLDCLKSPFISFPDTTDNADEFKKNVYRLEHDIIFHENISSNIDQYKKQLKSRLSRLSHWPQNSYKDLTNTLNFIQASARHLSLLYSSNEKIPLSDFFNTLLSSLETLGVLAEYQKDAAGLRLLETFEYLKQSLNHANPQLGWQDCRTWLALALESEHFTPLATDSCVQLMTLDQAAYLNFDVMIIAATESQHFPGSPESSPFFNQAVRSSLQLTTWEQQHRQRKALFQQVLLSAPNVLLTATKEENGEEKPISPWLELLINFYQLAFNDSTENQQLANIVHSQITTSYQANENGKSDDVTTEKLPVESTQAFPTLPKELLPERTSASAYQRLINCPYQYFSADGLQLKPLEEISDELKKADYGERIHLILQCFHQGHDQHGEAYSQPITQDNKSQAEDYLSNLSEKIFLQDMEDNLLHRSWLYRWQKHIPAYLDWQIQNQIDWKIIASEKNMEVNLSETDIKMYGRLDRIDQHREDGFHSIIDYKTGRSANQEDVDTGENIQLSTYALLDQNASMVSYLSLDSSKQEVKTKAFLSGDELNENRQLNKQRLIELFNQIQKQEPLPAWGDDDVCRYCNFSGLCRKQEWTE